MIENIATAAPSTIDIEIRRIDLAVDRNETRQHNLQKAPDRDSDRSDYFEMSENTRREMKHDLDTLVGQWAALVRERRPLTDEYVRRGSWNRFWIVSNGNGHVHWTTACRTCYPTTQFYWLAELSGMSHDDLVKQAGHRACTVCFPAAPVELSLREKAATSIFTPTEIERAAAKAERDAKKAAKIAAEPRTRDGQPLIVTEFGSNTQLKTERAARNFLLHELHSIGWYADNDNAEEHRNVAVIIDALAYAAAKAKTLADEPTGAMVAHEANLIKTEADAKTAKKLAKDRKEAAAYAAAHGM